MIKNGVYYLTQDEAKAIKVKLGKSVFIAEMNGRKIQTDEAYLREAWDKFKIPYPNEIPSWDGYNDWLTDLDWLNSEGYALFIYDFSRFMKKSKARKEHFIENLKHFILPFWEDEVTRVVVGGKAKPFNVYLVD